MERERLLSALKPRDRELIEGILAGNPGLTALTAIEYCNEATGLNLPDDVRD